jgi:nitroreductase
MDLLDAVHRRRSVRDYRTERIDDAVLRRLVDAAVWAPSALNEQPWHFTVVRDLRKLDVISKQAKTHMLSASAKAMPDHLRAMLANPDFQIFYHAPALIVISANGGAWAVEDCALAAQNLMLAACSEGLGSCWIGFAQTWLQTPDGKAALELPGGYLPVAPIIVGRPNTSTAAVPRKPAQIHWIG